MTELQQLNLPDHLVNVSAVNDDIVTALAPQGWYRAAEAASKAYGGQFWPLAGGMTWLHGRQRRYYIDLELWPRIVEARTMCREVGCEEGHTLGSCARNMLSYVVTEHSPSYPRTRHTGRTVISRGHVNYHDCTPGRYVEAWMYDMSSAYFALLCRAPSLCVDVLVSGGRLVWHPLGRREEERFQRVCSVVHRNKLLRNTLVGVLDGGPGKRVIWHKGERRLFGLPPGPFPALAALIRRTCWELTRAASEETNSVYSNVDCIVTTGPLPTIWERCGLHYSTHAHGDADICAGGIYRVGEHATIAYKNGHRRIGGRPRAAAPRIEWYRRWLL